MRRTFMILGLVAMGWCMPVITHGGDRIHKPRKDEPPANGYWSYVPTWRDRDPNQLDSVERALHYKSLRKESKFQAYFGDYVFLRPGTEMQYTWDVPSYKRSVR